MSNSTAAIHVAKKQLGLDDDTYRAKLELITGKSSTKAMTEGERQKVLTVLRNEGFAPINAAPRTDARQKLAGRFAKKLQALWIAGWNLGIVRDREDTALIAFVKRQAGVDHVRFLHDPADANRAIEALKGWLQRDGGVDWENTGLHPQSYMRQIGFKVSFAQWAIISPASRQDFWPVVTDLVGHGPLQRHLSDEEWIRVMNHFGAQIRKDGPKVVRHG